MIRATLVALGLLAAVPAAAQNFPNRTIVMVVPYAPGGSTDVLARILSRSMGQALGQTVVVENQGGAGGSIGTQRVVRAPADGYTLVFGNTGPLAANVALYPNLGYDPRKDLAPIGIGASNPMVIAASNRTGIKTMDELLGYLRREKDVATFGNAGPGSTSHLAGALFMQITRTNATAVGYRGVGPAMTDLTAGTIDALIDQTLTMIPAHNGKQVRALAVATEARLPQFPDVPTFKEAGVPQFNMAVWNALAAPAGTPQPVIDTLAKALSDALDESETRKRLDELAAVVPQGEERGPEALRRLIASEVDQWTVTVKEAGIKVE